MIKLFGKRAMMMTRAAPVKRAALVKRTTLVKRTALVKGAALGTMAIKTTLTLLTIATTENRLVKTVTNHLITAGELINKALYLRRLKACRLFYTPLNPT